ncbi:hypothetical protein [Saliterribacillus persicus]|nr:hypothetical protein [Saliterribacillus persicus]
MSEIQGKIIKELSKKIESLEIELKQQKKENLQINKFLYETYTREENVLYHFKKIKEKYEALKHSKLGKLTIKYWELKNRR